ncbi:hypothetical protein BDB00DRAFT_840921 [Zychaea mexicana]|uniref:uncharacterized protein n=1 Tax=Zychaea mexicana TaxID=64656 RepID=UPI0022FE794C|nr:uncharacterized protein BDB00DRAFT_840921 [Zychaea mexicana]KAI9489835.1 hypothetical protein BDB00DRAFT_840921 [Zychaea mexicana]
MPGKRKRSNNGKSDLTDSKAKNQAITATLAKQLRSVNVHSEKINIVEQTIPDVQTNSIKKRPAGSPSPMSAIAARKAAAVASLSSTSSSSTATPTTDIVEKTDTTATVTTTTTQVIRNAITPPEAAPDRESTSTSLNSSKGHKQQLPSSTSPINDESSFAYKPFRRRDPRIALTDSNLVSAFTPSEANMRKFTLKNVDETCLMVGLQKNEKIVFAGKALLAPLSGAVSILGFTLQPSSTDHIGFYPAFSPKTHSLLDIRPVDGSNVVQRKSTLCVPMDDAVKTALEDMDAQTFESVFLVMDMLWCGLDDIEDLAEVPRGIFELRMNSEHPTMTALDSIPGFQPLFSIVPDVKAMVIPPVWETCLHKALESEQERRTPFVGITCGSKDMGKSTFTRYLTNSLLNKHKKVAYLETDVGQSEFTPSGMVSLHIIESPVLGPPYTHQHIPPVHSHYIGALSPAINPSHYLDSIGHLLHLYKTEYDNQIDVDNADLVPLIINTQGWIGGLGYDLLISIIKQAAPTDVFVMHSSQMDASRNLPPTFTVAISPPPEQGPSPSMHYLECAVNPLAPKFSAQSSRELALISYLHQDLHNVGHIGQPWWNFQARIVDKLPWVLDWRKGLLDGVWFLTEDVPQSQMLYALNGTLVALVGSSLDEQRSRQQSNAPESTNDQIIPPIYFRPSENPPPAPGSTQCYGLAVIRAIDPANHAFHIVTPLPLATLKKVTAIVKGNIALPVSTLLDQHNGNGNGIARQPWNKVPYLERSIGVNGIGAIATKKRRIKIRK